MITKKKNFYQTVFSSIFLVFLGVGIIGFLTFTNWKISQKRAELQRKIDVLKKEIQALEEKNAALRAGISQTKSEDYQIKRLYGEGYFEKGAIPVVVLPTEKKAKEKTSEEKSPLSPQNLWEWLKSKMRQ